MSTETVTTRSDLIAAGLTARRITAAVRAGTLVRIRRDRYIAPGTSKDVRRAAALGGRLACVTALRALGIWVADRDTTHVEVPPNWSRGRIHPGVRVHWHAVHAPDDATAVCTSVFDALVQCCSCLPLELAVASLDSALQLGLLARWRLDELRAVLPRRHRRIVDRADGRCMSGIETLLRLALEDAGIPFEVQTRIPGVGYVDFLVAGSVIVETDGREWHSSDGHRARDHARDLAAARAGYVVIRLDYWQVMLQRDACVDAIRTVCATVGAQLRTERGPRPTPARRGPDGTKSS